MKVVIAIIVILALGWLAFNYLGTADTPSDQATTTEETMDDGTMNDGSMNEGASAENSVDAMTDEEAPADAVVFDLTGKKYEFSVKEIRVKKGDTVTINLESTDGLHDWVVDEFDAKTGRVQTGEKTSVTFVADTAGEFEYYCSVADHRAKGMVGTLIVEE